MDTIANLIIMLKNAGLVKKANIITPHSKMKMAILSVLKEEGFIKAFSKEGEEKKPVIEVALAYEKGEPKIKGVKRMSKPSKRVYMGVKEIKPVKYGHGTSLMSTPKGIMTSKLARKEMVGGEVLFTIW